MARKAAKGSLTRTQTAGQAYNSIVKKYGEISQTAKYMHKGKGEWVKYSIENDRKRTGKVTTDIKKWREAPHKLDFQGKDTKPVKSGKKSFSVAALKAPGKMVGRKAKPLIKACNKAVLKNVQPIAPKNDVKKPRFTEGNTISYYGKRASHVNLSKRDDEKNARHLRKQLEKKRADDIALQTKTADLELRQSMKTVREEDAEYKKLIDDRKRVREWSHSVEAHNITPHASYIVNDYLNGADEKVIGDIINGRITKRQVYRVLGKIKKFHAIPDKVVSIYTNEVKTVAEKTKSKTQYPTTSIKSPSRPSRRKSKVLPKVERTAITKKVSKPAKKYKNLHNPYNLPVRRISLNIPESQRETNRSRDGLYHNIKARGIIDEIDNKAFLDKLSIKQILYVIDNYEQYQKPFPENPRFIYTVSEPRFKVSQLGTPKAQLKKRDPKKQMAYKGVAITKTMSKPVPAKKKMSGADTKREMLKVLKAAKLDEFTEGNIMGFIMGDSRKRPKTVSELRKLISEVKNPNERKAKPATFDLAKSERKEFVSDYTGITDAIQRRAKRVAKIRTDQDKGTYKNADTRRHEASHGKYETRAKKLRESYLRKKQ
jgi:hypothetical protein